METLTTNEWLPATGNKWIKRDVLCRFTDGVEIVAKWNGFYWVQQNGARVIETVKNRIVAFYIYEKFNENDII